MVVDANDWNREREIFPLLKKVKPRSWFEMIPRLLEEEGSKLLDSLTVVEYISRSDQSRLAAILEEDPRPLFEIKGKCTTLSSGSVLTILFYNLEALQFST